jgi:hypothetical protein
MSIVSPSMALVVHDPGHTLSNVANSLAERAEAIKQQINQATQIGHDVTQLRQQLQQITDAITQIQTLMADPLGLQAMFGDKPPQKMSDADIARAIADRCPANGGSNPTQYVLNIARDALGASDPVMKKQQEICAQIVTQEGLRFNTMVRQYEVMEERADQLERIGRDGLDVETPGGADGQVIAGGQFLNAFTVEMEGLRLKAGFHTQMIEAYKSQQTWLAEQALKGNRPKGLVGMATQSLIQGAALEAALRVGR